MENVLAFLEKQDAALIKLRRGHIIALDRDARQRCQRHVERRNVEICSFYMRQRCFEGLPSHHSCDHLSYMTGRIAHCFVRSFGL